MNSNPMSWSRFVGMLATVALFSLALPTLAGAQGIVTVHPLKINLKLVFQDFSDNADLTARIGKGNVNEKDLFEGCTGNKPMKTQGIFLAIDCENSNVNRIVAANTNPVSVIAELGHIEFHQDFVVEAESRSGDLTTAVLPVDVELNTFACPGPALDASLTGVATVKFKALPAPNDAVICPNSATLDFNGISASDLEADALVDPAIVNVGSRIQAKNRSSSILIPAVEPAQ